MRLDISIYENDSMLRDRFEQEVTDTPGKMPGWYRTMLSIFRFFMKYYDPSVGDRIIVRFVE